MKWLPEPAQKSHMMDFWARSGIVHTNGMRSSDDVVGSLALAVLGVAFTTFTL